MVAGPSDPSAVGPLDGLPDVERTLMAKDEAAAVAWCQHRFGNDGSQLGDYTDFDWSASDQAYLEDGPIGAHFEDVTAEAFRQGISGYAQYIVIQGRPWPFELGGIDVPVHVAHGTEDRVVPVAHSRQLADSIPGADLIQLPDHGHASIIEAFPDLVATLAASTR